VILPFLSQQILVSIGVSIPACHAGDPGSIPGLRDIFLTLFFESFRVPLASKLRAQTLKGVPALKAHT
jgi:hypothetical protein